MIDNERIPRVPRGLTMARLALCFGLAILVSGCAGGGGDIRTEVAERLQSREELSPQKISFSELVPGSWTRMILACADASGEDVERELGFSWSEASAADTSQYLGLLAFVDDDDIEASAIFNGDEDGDGVSYFVPCPADGELEGVVSLSREDAYLNFEFSGETLMGEYWLLAGSEKARFAP